MSNWHYAKSGEKHGPITAAQLKELAKSGQLAPDDLVWREDMKEWRKAASVKGLFSSNQQPSSVSSPPQSVAAARQEELPFWKRPAVIALAFLLFWPAGAYLLWKKFNTSSTDSTSKFPSVPRSWVFAGAGIGAILLVGAIVLTITQTSAARKEIAKATTLWEEGRHEEAAVLYQTIINKRGSFIPDDQESLVYGRVIDYLSQHNRHQEARLILEKLNRLSPSATPFVESEAGRHLMADFRREQRRTKQQERRITKGCLGHFFEHPISSDDENYLLVEGCVRSFFDDSDAEGYTTVFKSLKGMNVYSFFTSKEIDAMKQPIEEVVLNTEKWTDDIVCRMPPPEAFQYTVTWNYTAKFYRLSSGSYTHYKTVNFVANTDSGNWEIERITFHVDYKNISVTPWFKDDTSKVERVSCECKDGWHMTGRIDPRTGNPEKVRRYGRILFWARFEDDGSVVTGGDKSQ